MKNIVVLIVALACATAAFAAQNYVQDTGVIPWTNTSAAVEAGQIVDLGDRYAIVLGDQASNVAGSVATKGVFSLQRADTNAIAAGAAVYYSSATGVTATAAADKYLGQCVEAVQVTTTLTNSVGEYNKFVKVDINVPQRQCIVGTDVQAYSAALVTFAAQSKATTNQAFINGAGTTSTLYISSGIITNVAP